VRIRCLESRKRSFLHFASRFKLVRCRYFDSSNEVLQDSTTERGLRQRCSIRCTRSLRFVLPAVHSSFSIWKAHLPLSFVRSFLDSYHPHFLPLLDFIPHLFRQRLPRRNRIHLRLYSVGSCDYGSVILILFPLSHTNIFR